jgi:hypothetical protein
MKPFLAPFWDRFWNSYLQIEAKMGKKEVQNMTPKLTKIFQNGLK